MRTVGQILKEGREAKFYTLDDVEKAIKIRKEILTALEADDYTKLPPEAFVHGFIKNYSRFLGLDEANVLAIFRREFSNKKYKPYIMDAFSKPINRKRLAFTPGRVIGVVVSLLIVTFFAYLWFQYRTFVGAPELTLIAPQDQLTSESDIITVEGKTNPEIKVTVNGQDIPVAVDGQFKQLITISSQVNKITVIANSRFGQKTQIDRTVYLKKQGL